MSREIEVSAGSELSANATLKKADQNCWRAIGGRNEGNMNDNLERIRERIASRSNEELLQMVKVDSSQYRPGSIGHGDGGD